MIGLQHPTDNEVQPVVAASTLATIKLYLSRAMRQSQAQQLRRRRSTPPCNVQQQRELVARDNAVEL
eukprot:1933338-Amphidinium_carterae.1